MNRSDNRRDRAVPKHISNAELALYGLLVLVTTISQVLLHGSKSIADTLAWVIVYAFILALLFFGWAKAKTVASKESEK